MWLNWLLVAVFLSVVAAVWWFAKPPAVFVVRIRHGATEVTHGQATAEFLATVAQLCQEQGVQTAEIRGVARGRRIYLWFSAGLPRGFCQPLRNWWAISGWSAGPSRS